MIDKLGGSFGPGGAPSTGGAKAQSGVNVARPTTDGGHGAVDQVSLTEQASRLLALDKTLSSLPGVDESRVAAARTAIEQGTYSFDARSVATALVGFESNLSGN
jgi:flagellar biosynthesis anti-sigma factor FlgM